MRKSGRTGRAQRGAFSVLERLATQRSAQQQREEQAKQAHDVAEPICGSGVEQDACEGSKDSRPRKSPKKHKKDSPGRSSQQNSSAEDRNSPRKSPEGKPAPGTGQPKARKVLAWHKPRPAEGPTAQPATAALPQETRDALAAQIELQPLDPGELQSGVLAAVVALRERLSDPTGGSPDAMALRPSLLEVQQGVEKLLRTTVEVPGENNSLLLVGARGAGKTIAVERAAAALEAQYNTEAANPRLGFVRLTGLAHLDERTAFREIARQLCRIFACHFAKHASLEDNLEFLRDMLKELRRCHKVVVFLLEEFDLFARKPKQTLLYNLLDAMQASNMQAAVVGMSCRCDVTELLEKRVKSRFSYRRRLVLEPGADQFGDAGEGPPAILGALLRLPEEHSSLPAGFSAHFNAAVGAALQHEEVLARMRVLCDKGYGSPRALANLGHWALNLMLLDASLLQPRHLLAAIQAALDAPNSQVEAVMGCSILELFMLVAVERLRRRGRETANFEMALYEYSTLRRGGSYRGVDDAASRPAAFRAFERLITANLLAYCDPRTEDRAMLREFAPVAILVTRAELEAGLRGNPNFPSALLEWLSKETIMSYAGTAD